MVAPLRTNLANEGPTATVRTPGTAARRYRRPSTATFSPTG